MNPGEFLLAAVLLAGPSVPVVDSSGGVAWAEVLRAPLLALAMDAELADPREVKTWNAWGALEPGALRERWRALRAAPMVGEGERFPDRKYINEVLALNRNLRNHLTARLAIDLVNAEEIRAAIVETDRLYHVWDTVRDARCEYYWVTVRRQALQLLRSLLGDEAYYSGVLPAPIPLQALPRR